MTRVLAVKTSSMGDVIHAFAAIADARAAFPDLQIDWLVEEAFVPLARLHPAVRQVIPVAIRRWRKALLKPGQWRTTLAEICALRRTLRANAYTLAVDLQGLIKSAVVARLAGVPIHGFDAGSAREPLAARLEHHGHFASFELHEIERLRLIFAKALGYVPDTTQFHTGLERPYGGGRNVLLFHGTTWISKLWPLENWIGLANGLVALGFRPVVTDASDAELAFANAIVAGAPGTLHVPRQSLEGIAGVLGGAAAAVGGDTGLIHLAAAFGVPTYALFMGSSPGHAAPRGRYVHVVQSTAPCSPCQSRSCKLGHTRLPLPCHDSIPADRVLALFVKDMADGVFALPSD